jgi:hypothetical protein
MMSAGGGGLFQPATLQLSVLKNSLKGEPHFYALTIPLKLKLSHNTS